VANGTNGTVSLLGDGYTARFVPTNNFSGLASFNFTATEPANGLSVGPVNVGVLVTTTNAPNTPPTLPAISDYTLIAGATLSFTNAANDTDLPAQSLTYSLLGNPTNATVTTNTGVFNWRPTLAQGGTSNLLRMVVADGGTPSQSATQAFNVFVNWPAAPTAQSIGLSNNLIRFSVNGDAGPDYSVLVSTNLSQWENVFTTNSPALPFWWTDTNSGSFPRRYYRLQLGP
jgi:hypothetical protein